MARLPGLEKFMQEVHDTAVEKGWWELGDHKTPLECVALMVAELAEAMEEVRKGTPPLYKLGYDKDDVWCDDARTITPDKWKDPNVSLDPKPEGIATELADCLLRIFDFAVQHKLPLIEAMLLKHEFNKTRPYRHGKKL